jgi:hypothetical protein
MPVNPPTPAKEYERPEYMVTLGLLPPYMADDVEKAYLAKIKQIRPDLGGDREAFYAVQKAYMAAKEYVQFRGDRRGWIAKRMDEYLAVQEIIGRIKQFGAEVETDALNWLQKSFGDFAELTENVTGIRLQGAANGDKFIDYIVSQHPRLLELWWLDLSGSTVTDAAVRQLVVFRRLAELNLNHTPITRHALVIVNWLPELDTLHVEETGLNWLTKKKLAMQLHRKREATAAIRSVHPTNMRV